MDRLVKTMVYDREKNSDVHSEPSVGFFSTLSFFESLGSDESMVTNGNGKKMMGSRHSLLSKWQKKMFLVEGMILLNFINWTKFTLWPPPMFLISPSEILVLSALFRPQLFPQILSSSRPHAEV